MKTKYLFNPILTFIFLFVSINDLSAQNLFAKKLKDKDLKNWSFDLRDTLNSLSDSASKQLLKTYEDQMIGSDNPKKTAIFYLQWAARFDRRQIFSAKYAISQAELFVQKLDTTTRFDIYLLSTSIYSEDTIKCFEYFNKALRLKNSPQDKILIYTAYASLYNKLKKPILEKEYLGKGIAQAKLIGDSLQAAGISLNLSMIQYRGYELQKALIVCQSALDLTENYKNHKIRAQVLLHLANIYKRQLNYDGAIVALRESYTIFEKVNDFIGVQYALEALAKIYLFQDRYDRALLTFKQLRPFLHNQNLSRYFNDMSQVYSNKYQMFQQKDTARFYLDSLNNNLLKFPNPEYKGLYLVNLGIIYFDSSKVLGLEMVYEGYLHFMQNNINFFAVQAFNEFAKLYMRALHSEPNLRFLPLYKFKILRPKDLELETQQVMKEVNIWSSASYDLYAILELYGSLLEMQNQFEPALEAQKRASLFKDSLNNKKLDLVKAQNTNTISRLVAEKENEKLKLINFENSQQLKLEQVKNSQILIALVFLIILLITSIYLWLSNRETKKLLEVKSDLINKQNEDLKALADSKNQFFSNVAHELKTPLTLILGTLDLLEKEIPELQKERLEAANSQVYKISKLIEEILELGKLSEGKANLNTSKLSLVQFISTLIKAFNLEAERKQIEIDWQYPNEEYIIETDEYQLEKIVSNLVSNALKFTPNGGYVSLKLYLTADKNLQLEVSDTGIGIPKEEIPQIFSRFYQSSNAKYHEGSGLGLAIAQSCAKNIGASIQVSSQLNIGTSFTVSFENPIIQIAELKQDTLAETDSSTPNIKHINEILGRMPNMLLVEDHAEVGAYMAEILGKEFNILQAFNGKQALDMLHKNQIDFICSDVMMPEMNGLEFLNAVKSLHQYRLIPFMMVTASDKKEEMLRALDLGVDEYISKPFNNKELQVRVKRLFNNYLERLLARKYEGEAKVALSDNDFMEGFNKKLFDVVKANFPNPDFNILQLAEELFMSERSMSRKVKLEIGITPSAYLREFRLQQARKMLEKHPKPNVSEVAHACGFKHPGHFSQLFAKHFGVSPSDY